MPTAFNLRRHVVSATHRFYDEPRPSVPTTSTHILRSATCEATFCTALIVRTSSVQVIHNHRWIMLTAISRAAPANAIRDASPIILTMTARPSKSNFEQVFPYVNSPSKSIASSGRCMPLLSYRANDSTHTLPEWRCSRINSRSLATVSFMSEVDRPGVIGEKQHLCARTRKRFLPPFHLIGPTQPHTTIARPLGAASVIRNHNTPSTIASDDTLARVLRAPLVTYAPPLGTFCPPPPHTTQPSFLKEPPGYSRTSFERKPRGQLRPAALLLQVACRICYLHARHTPQPARGWAVHAVDPASAHIPFINRALGEHARTRPVRGCTSSRLRLRPMRHGRGRIDNDAGLNCNPAFSVVTSPSSVARAEPGQAVHAVWSNCGWTFPYCVMPPKNAEEACAGLAGPSAAGQSRGAGPDPVVGKPATTAYTGRSREVSARVLQHKSIVLDASERGAVEAAVPASEHGVSQAQGTRNHPLNCFLPFVPPRAASFCFTSQYADQSARTALKQEQRRRCPETRFADVESSLPRRHREGATKDERWRIRRAPDAANSVPSPHRGSEIKIARRADFSGRRQKHAAASNRPSLELKLLLNSKLLVRPQTV
ncbi:hypothetical protein BDW22DRAFT_1341850 [Trametopsis cervina]|nr:hypothetical protein BDW22DRAFT_1341850 [Trametopsis cervina]